MEVKTATPELEQRRATLVQLLMADQPPADEDPKETTTADNELLELARRYEVIQVDGIPPAGGRGIDTSNPVISVNHDACILCDRCVRACDDVQGNDVIGRSGKGYTARIAFDLNDPMGESSCVTCGECVAACPTGALVNKPIRDVPIRAREDLDQVDTVCPYCGVGCALTYNVDRERNAISFAEGREQPGSQRRLCVKGRYGWDYAQSPQRLTVPLIRREGSYPKGPLSSDVRGEGRGRKKPGGLVDYGEVLPHFREASWEEALDLVAGRLKEIHDEDGPGAIAGFGSAKCSNEEAYLFQKLIRAGFGTNNVDHCTRLCHASSVAALFEGVGSGAVSTTYGDIVNADVAILAGTNTTANHPVASSFFKQAHRRGTTLIVVDPRRERIADHADIFCQIKPGTDVAFYNGVMHEIIALDLVDREFIAERVSELRRAGQDRAPVPARAGGPDLRRGRGHDSGGGPPVGRGRRGGHLLGDGDLPAHHRHRQRPLPHRPVQHHRAGGPAGHRAASAAGPEQRAGRVRRRPHPDVLPRLPAGRGGRGARSLRGGLGPRAGPQPRPHRHRDHRVGAQGRGAGDVHDGREPVPVRPEPEQGAQGPGRARLPRRAGHLPHRDRRVRRRDPARQLLHGEGGHLHQHRPAGADRPQGARAARPGARGLAHPVRRRGPDRAADGLRVAARDLRRAGVGGQQLRRPLLRQPQRGGPALSEPRSRALGRHGGAVRREASAPTTAAPIWCRPSGCRPRSCRTRSTRSS